MSIKVTKVKALSIHRYYED